MSQPRMDPSLAKRFRTGRPSLDFAHTAATQYWVEPELVYDPASLQRWLGYVLELAGVRAQTGDVAEAHRLRAALLRLARARAGGQPLAAADVRTLNAFAAAAPPAPQLAAAGTVVPLTVTATAGLSAIARDAIDLLAGPLGQRIRVCAAPDCEFLFVDASRPGTRRWCSMERCGNLAKVRTHREQAGRLGGAGSNLRPWNRVMSGHSARSRRLPSGSPAGRPGTTGKTAGRDAARHAVPGHRHDPEDFQDRPGHVAVRGQGMGLRAGL